MDEITARPLPVRPVRLTRTLSNAATYQQRAEHYAAMLDYWIDESQWHQVRADQLNAELSAFLRSSQKASERCRDYLPREGRDL